MHEAVSTETGTRVLESPSGRRHLYTRARVEHSVASSRVASSRMRLRHVSRVWFKCATTWLVPPQRFSGLGYSHPLSNPSKNGINSEKPNNGYTVWNEWCLNICALLGQVDSSTVLKISSYKNRGYIMGNYTMAHIIHMSTVHNMRKRTKCCRKMGVQLFQWMEISSNIFSKIFSAFSHRIRIFALHHFFTVFFFSFLHHVKKNLSSQFAKFRTFPRVSTPWAQLLVIITEKNWTEFNQIVLNCNFPEKIAIKQRCKNAKTRICDANAKMQKSDRSMRCDAITLKNSGNAMRMRKLIRITSPGLWYGHIRSQSQATVWVLLNGLFCYHSVGELQQETKIRTMNHPCICYSCHTSVWE